ncbi:ChaB family protein [Oscillatoria sp. FACHB-1407]|uniref:ChaB family protein n=1 Tax=Oscillatoria sp. FACHB-1407 TaxID=2692847 RepID=UPI001684FF11|nr:ChaB family protein [Oscillatoria sp. FACHB-1407]MBD2460921.1 ChaB family protein [Oscillatoria sp. FACHB-1407]
MPYQSIESLPQEIKQNLPQGAQQVFLAAFNSAESDGLSQEGATQVAWNSVRAEYSQEQNGQWAHKNDDRDDAVDTSPLGSMHAS